MNFSLDEKNSVLKINLNVSLDGKISLYLSLDGKKNISILKISVDLGLDGKIGVLKKK